MTYKQRLLFTGIDLKRSGLEELSHRITACRAIPSESAGGPRKRCWEGLAPSPSASISLLRQAAGAPLQYIFTATWATKTELGAKVQIFRARRTADFRPSTKTLYYPGDCDLTQT